MTAVTLASVAPTALAEALRRLRTLVSPYTGIVTAVGELAAAPHDARLVKVASRVADAALLTGADVEYRSGGSAPSRDLALAAALGEAAERYSASYVPVRGVRLATARELGPAAVPPERFALFAEHQYDAPSFPFRRFTRHARVRWVEGFSIPDGSSAWLPVQLVYLPWRTPRDSGEEAIAYSTSNGMACGCTLEEAVLSGLLELVERDAFMVAWASRLSLPRLDWSGHRELAAHDRRYFRPSGLAYAAVDLSPLLSVPTVLGVVRDESGRGAALGVGAAAAVTIEDAWRRALAEAFAVRSWAEAMRVAGAPRAFASDYSDIASFDDHVEFYASAEHAELTRFLDASAEMRDVRTVEPVEGEDVKEWIEALARRLEARRSSAYAVEITAADVRAAGLRVAKVVAPELCALDVTHEGRFLGGQRLYRAAFEAGLRARPLAPGELNPLPHPFP